MSQVDEVLTLLLDGKWHDIPTIAGILGIKKDKLRRILQLLEKFNFIESENEKTRISHDTKKFIQSVQQLLYNVS